MDHFAKVLWIIAIAVPLSWAGSLRQLSPEILKVLTEGSYGTPLMFQLQPQHQVLSQSQQFQEIPLGSVTTSTLPQTSIFSPASSGSVSPFNQNLQIPSIGAIRVGNPGGSTLLSSLIENSGVESGQSYGTLNSYLQAASQAPAGSSSGLPLIFTTTGGSGSGPSSSYGAIPSTPPRVGTETVWKSTGQHGNMLNVPYFGTTTGANEAFLRPSYGNRESIVQPNSAGSIILNSRPIESNVQHSLSNAFGSFPANTRPFITFFNKPSNIISGTYLTNDGAAVVKPVFQNGVSGLTLPNLSGNGYILANAGLAGSHIRPSDSSYEISKVPCLLHIPNPVPIAVTSGATQVSTPTLPNFSSIPASYIDHSPPTIGVLRPPSSSESIVESEAVIVAAAVPSSFKTVATRSPADTQVENVGSWNDELPKSDDQTIVQGLARNGLPFIYTLLPAPYSSPIVAGTGGDGSGTSHPSSVPTSFKSKNRNPASSSSSRRAQQKNPFFSVNKRKHFEYYEYF